MLGALLLSLPLPTRGTTRVAIFPFHSTEPANRPALVELADRLGRELSHRNGFLILPPDRVREAAARLPSGSFGPPTELAWKTGRSLTADWIILGTLASTPSGTNLWTSVIDLEGNMVTDVHVVAWNPQESPVTELTRFIGGAGMLAPKRPLLVLDPSAPWLAAISRHYSSQGYLIVAPKAVEPFLAWIRPPLNTAQAPAGRQPRLLPPLWSVGPVATTNEGSSLALRVVRFGDTPRDFPLLETGPKLEQEAIRAVDKAIAVDNSMNQAKARTAASGALWDAEMQRQRALERVNGPPLSMIPSGATDRQAALNQSMRIRRESTLASFERALALNPNDQEAKYWIGYGNLFSHDPAEARRGRQLLNEVTAGLRPDMAERARRALSFADQMAGRTGSVPSPLP